MIDEWASFEELQRDLKIDSSQLKSELPKLIDSGFVEEKYGSYRVNNSDGQANSRIKSFLDNLENKYKYYPVIRHGYLHFKHKIDEKPNFEPEVIAIAKQMTGYDLMQPEGDILQDCVLFEVDEKTKWILSMTKNEISKRELPFKKMVLDIDLKLDNKWFKGFFLSDGVAWTFWGDTELDCDVPLIFVLWESDKTKLTKMIVQPKDKKISDSTIQKVQLFLINFLDFLNNPEVRIVQIARSEKNVKRRLKLGKEVLPSSRKILVTGKLKTYYDSVNIDEHRTLNYRFWVRGHFMRFWNKKKYNGLYEQLELNKLSDDYYVDEKIRVGSKIIMRWKKPHIKGSGILINKKYEVRK